MLQEAHVAVEQRVGRRQDPHRLHPGAPLLSALHRHVGEAGEAKVAAFPEVAAEGGKMWVWKMRQWVREKRRQCQMAAPAAPCQDGRWVGRGGDLGPHPNIWIWLTLFVCLRREPLTWSRCWLGGSRWRWLWTPLPPGPCLWVDTTPTCYLCHTQTTETDGYIRIQELNGTWRSSWALAEQTGPDRCRRTEKVTQRVTCVQSRVSVKQPSAGIWAGLSTNFFFFFTFSSTTNYRMF